MADYNFTKDESENLEKALDLMGTLSDMELLCVPQGFINGIIEELNKRGIEVNYEDYFGTD